MNLKPNIDVNKDIFKLELAKLYEKLDNISNCYTDYANSHIQNGENSVETKRKFEIYIEEFKSFDIEPTLKAHRKLVKLELLNKLFKSTNENKILEFLELSYNRIFEDS